MRADAAAADRNESVRRAAADWQRAGWIDEAARVRIDQCYPDDRVRAGPVFRILFFVLTVCALLGALGILYPSTHSAERIGAVASTAGLACVGVTEYLLGPKRRRQGGIETAFSAVALAQLMIGIAVSIDSTSLGSENELALDLLLFGLLATIAAWRWGYWFYSAAGTILLFLAAGRLGWGRIVWIAVPAGLFVPLLKACDSPRLPPALRKCAAAALGSSLVLLYAAVNIYSLDQRMVESWFLARHAGPPAIPRSVSILCTAVMPVMLLAFGIRSRRRLLSGLAMVMIAASLVTVRQYSHLAPLWLALCAAGGALMAVSILLGKYLHMGEGRERGGFTAEPLLDNPRNRRALEMLASVASLTPHARAVQSSRPEIEGGGGTFGGGGASGNF